MSADLSTLETSLNQLREAVQSTYGSAGSEWLAGLPERIHQAIERFGLSDIGAVRHGSTALIIEVLSEAGTPAVLKAAFPSPDSRFEAEVLRRAQGQGYVRLINSDPVHGFSVLERMRPDSDVYALGEAEDTYAVGVLLACIRRMWHGEGEHNSTFPTVQDFARELVDAATDQSTPCPPGWTRAELLRAHDEFEELLSDEPDRLVLHGDLHHGNVMLSAEGKPTAVDPKGVVGPLGYELGAFLRNPFPNFHRWSSPSASIAQRIFLLSEGLEMDSRSILRWARAQLALTAVWGRQDNNLRWCRYVAALRSEFDAVSL